MFIITQSKSILFWSPHVLRCWFVKLLCFVIFLISWPVGVDCVTCLVLNGDVVIWLFFTCNWNFRGILIVRFRLALLIWDFVGTIKLLFSNTIICFGLFPSFDTKLPWKGWRMMWNFFFLISNKDIYSRNYLMHKNIRQREKYNGKEREKRKKEGNERILIIQDNLMTWQDFNLSNLSHLSSHVWQISMPQIIPTQKITN